MNQVETIVTLTMNPALDLSAEVDSVVPDHKLRCAGVRHDPGGGGINVSRALKRLGCESLAIYSSGGPNGHALGSLLDTEGICHRSFPIRGNTRQDMTFLERATGGQYRFVCPGPVLTDGNCKRALAALRMIQPASRLIVASGSLPQGVPDHFYADVAALVGKRGGRLILDTSGPALKLALEKKVYLIKPSMRELNFLVGAKPDCLKNFEDKAFEIICAGQCEAVVVSLGAGGAILVAQGERRRFKAPLVKVRSSVGAGDSMVAGITWALARHLPLEQAVRFGVAAGTAAVMNPGTELCHRSDVQNLFPQIVEISKELPVGAG